MATPSKSYTHRAMILGALSGNRFLVENPLVSDDTAATLSALSMMGATIERRHDSILIESHGLSPPEDRINAWNSGTTLRLIAGVAGLLDGRTSITGDESLMKRPMDPLLQALRDLGAECENHQGDPDPFIEITGPLTGEKTRLPGDISSQFISSLLISCPMKKQKTVIEIMGERKSAPYVDITLFMLEKMGVEILERSDGFSMMGGQNPSGDQFLIPGDFSAASFPLVAAAISKGPVTVKELDISMPQADSQIVEALERYGATVEIRDNGVTCSTGERRPFDFDVGQSPDLFPILGVLASTAKGESRLTGGEHLRFKESNRISTTVSMLRDIGVKAEEKSDGCIIRGDGGIRGGKVDTQGDHRILMSCVVAGMASEEGVHTVDDSSYKISYPNFIADIRSLGGALEEVDS